MPELDISPLQIILSQTIEEISSRDSVFYLNFRTLRLSGDNLKRIVGPVLYI